jgi:FMN phosphatase YigB (HAD superfamily)/rhamnose utilization protein RhaD (predicted bifunctional aldolase and dehydrogenase)
MFYKGIIFDLDNTLYSYDICHDKSIQTVFDYLQTNYTITQISPIYDKIKTSLKYDLDYTASSHNKSIFFKNLLEYYRIDLSILQTIQTLYWTTFLENIKLFEGVREFIKWNREIGIKIGILTDYETEYQIQKLHKLDILGYIDVIVTSEEVGIEKPSTHMFQTILHKMKLAPDEIIMIGDNYEKDIKGANNMNIRSYWFTDDIQKKQTQSFITTQFSSWIDLYNDFTEIHTNLTNLSNMSKYVGQRIDLVQAGGGNSSVKYKDTLFIKSSGITMANITPSLGYTMIDNKELTEDIYNNETKDVINYTIMTNSKRPSIETYMHAILKKYTLHLHPIQVNRILIRADAKPIIHTLFPEALVIDYFTPGIKVCDEIRKTYNNENIIFLLNHGLIITTDDYNDIYKYLDYVIATIELYISEENQISVDLRRYKYVSDISRFIYHQFKIQMTSYLCENQTINHFLKTNENVLKEPHTVPDELIYCGITIAFIDNLHGICNYNTIYQELPKIIVINNTIYIISHSMTKCKEIEEVLLSKLLLSYDNENKTSLSKNEICFLNNWDSEKYRQQLK